MFHMSIIYGITAKVPPNENHPTWLNIINCFWYKHAKSTKTSTYLYSHIYFHDMRRHYAMTQRHMTHFIDTFFYGWVKEFIRPCRWSGRQKSIKLISTFVRYTLFLKVPEKICLFMIVQGVHMGQKVMKVRRYEKSEAFTNHIFLYTDKR